MLNEHICQMLTPGNCLPCKHCIRPNEQEEPGFCSQGSNFFCTEGMKKYLPAISYSLLSDSFTVSLRSQVFEVDESCS
jgi:hypothetical protein